MAKPAVTPDEVLSLEEQPPPPPPPVHAAESKSLANPKTEYQLRKERKEQIESAKRAKKAEAIETMGGDLRYKLLKALQRDNVANEISKTIVKMLHEETGQPRTTLVVQLLKELGIGVAKGETTNVNVLGISVSGDMQRGR